MSKFKVGDTVIRNSKNNSYYSFFTEGVNAAPVGTIVTIAEVSGHAYRVVGDRYDVPSWCNMDNNFDLYEAKELSKKDLFEELAVICK